MNSSLIKDIPGYEGLYQAHRLGHIISLPRKVKCGTGFRKTKPCILNPNIDRYGYLYVNLYGNGKHNTTIHKIIALTFIGERPNGCEINHIDGNKFNNIDINLDYVTPRENSVHYRKKQNTSSQFVGVSWCKRSQKWMARIWVDKKNVHLGYYVIELDAAQAYLDAAKRLEQDGHL